MNNFNNKKILCALIIFISVITADAALYYTPSEYNAIYNEKIALQLELKTLNRQFQNEKKKYETTISELRSVIDGLKREIEQLKAFNAEQKKL